MDDVVFVIDGLFFFSFMKKKFCISYKIFGQKNTYQAYVLHDHSKIIDNWIFKLPKHKWEEPKNMIQFNFLPPYIIKLVIDVLHLLCMYVCFPLLIFRSEMFPSRRRYDLTTICPRDTYGSYLGLTWLSPASFMQMQKKVHYVDKSSMPKQKRP